MRSSNPGCHVTKVGCIALVIVPGLLACANVTHREGFDSVSQDARARLGAELVWYDGGESEDQISTRTTTLLAQPLTATTAVQVALLNNRSLQGTLQELHISQADVVESGLLKNPVFSGDFRFSGQGINFEFTLIQNFVAALQIPMRKRMAEAQWQGTKAQVLGEAIELAARTKLLYYDYQASLHMLRLARQSLLSREASCELALRLNEAGNITDLALAEQRAMHASQKLSVSALEQEVIEAREELNAEMGLWKNPDSWQIADELPRVVAHLPNVPDVSGQAVERSLDLASARQRVISRAEMFGLADKFALLMDGALGPAAAKEPDSGWASGFSAAIPIPLFNQGQPAVFRARAELQQSVEEYAAMTVNVKAEARSLSRQAAVADERARHFQSSLLPLRRQVVQETKLQYNAMQIGPFELLEAKNLEIAAQQSYVDSLKSYWMVRTKLEALMSGRMVSDARSS